MSCLDDLNDFYAFYDFYGLLFTAYRLPLTARSALSDST
jgi:hypothetical protein